LPKQDHWLVEKWAINLDYRKEILENFLHELELNHEWFIENQIDSEDYLKMMIYYEILALEIDLKKIKPIIHENLKQGANDTLSLNFMDFAIRDMTQSEKIIKDTPKCNKH
jgi:hypothetical protein